MYKLKLSILLNLMFISTFTISKQGCHGKSEGNVLKFGNSQTLNKIRTKYNIAPLSNVEEGNLETQINMKELELTANLVNKHTFKEAPFRENKILNHNKPSNFSMHHVTGRNHIQNIEKQLLIATEKLKDLFKPIRIHKKIPTQNYNNLEKQKRSLEPKKQIVEPADKLRYAKTTNRRFDMKYGHLEYNVSHTGANITQTVLNKSSSGNQKGYLKQNGHILSLSPEEPSEQQNWNIRKNRDIGDDLGGWQDDRYNYFANPHTPYTNPKVPPILFRNNYDFDESQNYGNQYHANLADIFNNHRYDGNSYDEREQTYSGPDYDPVVWQKYEQQYYENPFSLRKKTNQAMVMPVPGKSESDSRQRKGTPHNSETTVPNKKPPIETSHMPTSNKPTTTAGTPPTPTTGIQLRQTRPNPDNPPGHGQQPIYPGPINNPHYIPSPTEYPPNPIAQHSTGILPPQNPPDPEHWPDYEVRKWPNQPGHTKNRLTIQPPYIPDNPQYPKNPMPQTTAGFPEKVYVVDSWREYTHHQPDYRDYNTVQSDNTQYPPNPRAPHNNGIAPPQNPSDADHWPGYEIKQWHNQPGDTNKPQNIPSTIGYPPNPIPPPSIGIPSPDHPFDPGYPPNPMPQPSPGIPPPNPTSDGGYWPNPTPPPHPTPYPDHTPGSGQLPIHPGPIINPPYIPSPTEYPTNPMVPQSSGIAPPQHPFDPDYWPEYKIKEWPNQRGHTNKPQYIPSTIGYPPNPIPPPSIGIPSTDHPFDPGYPPNPMPQPSPGIPLPNPTSDGGSWPNPTPPPHPSPYPHHTPGSGQLPIHPGPIINPPYIPSTTEYPTNPMVPQSSGIGRPQHPFDPDYRPEYKIKEWPNQPGQTNKPQNIPSTIGYPTNPIPPPSIGIPSPDHPFDPGYPPNPMPLPSPGIPLPNPTSDGGSWPNPTPPPHPSPYPDHTPGSGQLPIHPGPIIYPTYIPSTTEYPRNPMVPLSTGIAPPQHPFDPDHWPEYKIKEWPNQPGHTNKPQNIPSTIGYPPNPIPPPSIGFPSPDHSSDPGYPPNPMPLPSPGIPLPNPTSDGGSWSNPTPPPHPSPYPDHTPGSGQLPIHPGPIISPPYIPSTTEYPRNPMVPHSTGIAPPQHPFDPDYWPEYKINEGPNQPGHTNKPQNIPSTIGYPPNPIPPPSIGIPSSDHSSDPGYPPNPVPQPSPGIPLPNPTSDGGSWPNPTPPPHPSPYPGHTPGSGQLPIHPGPIINPPYIPSTTEYPTNPMVPQSSGIGRPQHPFDPDYRPEYKIKEWPNQPGQTNKPQNIPSTIGYPTNPIPPPSIGIPSPDHPFDPGYPPNPMPLPSPGIPLPNPTSDGGSWPNPTPPPHPSPYPDHTPGSGQLPIHPGPIIYPTYIPSTTEYPRNPMVPLSTGIAPPQHPFDPDHWPEYKIKEWPNQPGHTNKPQNIPSTIGYPPNPIPPPSIGFPSPDHSSDPGYPPNPMPLPSPGIPLPNPTSDGGSWPNPTPPPHPSPYPDHTPGSGQLPIHPGPIISPPYIPSTTEYPRNPMVPHSTGIAPPQHPFDPDYWPEYKINEGPNQPGHTNKPQNIPSTIGYPPNPIPPPSIGIPSSDHSSDPGYPPNPVPQPSPGIPLPNPTSDGGSWPNPTPPPHPSPYPGHTPGSGQLPIHPGPIINPPYIPSTTEYPRNPTVPHSTGIAPPHPLTEPVYWPIYGELPIYRGINDKPSYIPSVTKYPSNPIPPPSIGIPSPDHPSDPGYPPNPVPQPSPGIPLPNPTSDGGSWPNPTPPPHPSPYHDHTPGNGQLPIHPGPIINPPYIPSTTEYPTNPIVPHSTGIAPPQHPFDPDHWPEYKIKEWPNQPGHTNKPQNIPSTIGYPPNPIPPPSIGFPSPDHPSDPGYPPNPVPQPSPGFPLPNPTSDGGSWPNPTPPPHPSPYPGHTPGSGQLPIHPGPIINPPYIPSTTEYPRNPMVPHSTGIAPPHPLTEPDYWPIYGELPIYRGINDKPSYIPSVTKYPSNPIPPPSIGIPSPDHPFDPGYPPNPMPLPSPGIPLPNQTSDGGSWPNPTPPPHPSPYPDHTPGSGQLPIHPGPIIYPTYIPSTTEYPRNPMVPHSTGIAPPQHPFDPDHWPEYKIKEWPNQPGHTNKPQNIPSTIGYPPNPIPPPSIGFPSPDHPSDPGYPPNPVPQPSPGFPLPNPTSDGGSWPNPTPPPHPSPYPGHTPGSGQLPIHPGPIINPPYIPSTTEYPRNPMVPHSTGIAPPHPLTEPDYWPIYGELPIYRGINDKPSYIPSVTKYPSNPIPPPSIGIPSPDHPSDPGYPPNPVPQPSPGIPLPNPTSDGGSWPNPTPPPHPSPYHDHTPGNGQLPIHPGPIINPPYIPSTTEYPTNPMVPNSTGIAPPQHPFDPDHWPEYKIKEWPNQPGHTNKPQNIPTPAEYPPNLIPPSSTGIPPPYHRPYPGNPPVNGQPSIHPGPIFNPPFIPSTTDYPPNPMPRPSTGVPPPHPPSVPDYWPDIGQPPIHRDPTDYVSNMPSSKEYPSNPMPQPIDIFPGRIISDPRCTSSYDAKAMTTRKKTWLV